MSDLISRSALLQMLKYNKAIHEDENGETRQLVAVDINKVIEYVEKMPTAYDVEAVEKELEAFKTTTWSDFMEEEVEIINLERAKKIVRAVGKE